MINDNVDTVKNYIARGMALSYLSSIVGIIAGLISVPMMLNYFDNEQYGIWTLITGIIGYLSLTNFGIPTAAAVIIAMRSNNYEKFLAFNKSFFLLAFASTVALILAYIFGLMFPGWVSIIGKISLSNITPAKEALIVMGISFLIKAALSIPLSAFSAFQRVDIVKTYELINVIITFLAMWWTIHIGADIAYLAWVTSIPSVMLSLLSLVHFRYKYNHIREKKDFEPKNVSTRLIVSSSFSFFQVGLASILIWGSGNFIISHMINVESVPPYAICLRLFSVGYMLFNLINGLLLPIYGNALSKNDWVKMQNLYELQISILPIIAGLVWIGGIIFSKDIVHLWTGRDDMYGGFLLAFSLGGYGFILSHVNIYSGIMTALNYSGKIVRISWLEALLNITLSLFFVSMLGLGGAALGAMLAAVCPLYLMPKYITSLSKGKLKGNLKGNIRQFKFAVLPCVVLASVFVSYIDYFLFSFIFFIFLVIYYMSISWKLLSLETQNFILNMVKYNKRIY